MTDTIDQMVPRNSTQKEEPIRGHPLLHLQPRRQDQKARPRDLSTSPNRLPHGGQNARALLHTQPIIGADTENGTFDLVIKTYFPTDQQPGGALSNILDCMEEGEEVEIRGPTGDIKYIGDGKFQIFDQEERFENITLILGGSGITPGYQLIARVLATASDKTKIKVIDANKDEKSILLREDLDKFAQEHEDKFEICHILSHPSDDWKGEKGHVDEDKIKQFGYAPEKESGKKNAVFLCGPPAMIQKAAMPALRNWVSEICFPFSNENLC